MEATLLNSSGVAGTSNWPDWLMRELQPITRGETVDLPAGKYGFFELNVKGELILTDSHSRRIIIDGKTNLESNNQSASLQPNSTVVFRIGGGTISLRVNSL